MKYEKAAEVKALAQRIKNQYPTQFDHLDLDRILFVKYTAERGFGRAIARVNVVREPISLVTPIRFVLSVKGSRWGKLSASQRAILVMHELLHIKKFDPPTLRYHDIEDFKSILKRFGLDWVEDTKVGSPLKKEDKS